ncbi:MAG: hypothetical protein JWM11_7298, partial [Planctomycetaceae bacterium]|nr:hypothetical protein [Planctomycetaceae bacterium]
GAKIVIEVYMRTLQPTNEIRAICKSSYFGERGNYYDCGSFLELRTALRAAYAHSEAANPKRDAAIKFFTQLGGHFTRNFNQQQERDVFSLDLRSIPVTDRDLEQIANLKDLDSLDLFATKLTDRGMKELPGLWRLSSLDLHSTDISNDGVNQLSKCENLKNLNLGKTHISDEGLESISRLQHLTELDLSQTNVTVGGLASLINMRDLTRLNLTGVKLTTDEIRVLSQDLPKGCEIISK